MWQRNSYGRRVLISGSSHSFAHGRTQYAALTAEQSAIVAELADVRDQFIELREVVQLVLTALRRQADVDVVTLRRQLEVALARLERDPNRPLN